MWKCEVEILVAGADYKWIERTFYAPTYDKVYTKVDNYLKGLVGFYMLEQHITFSILSN